MRSLALLIVLAAAAPAFAAGPTCALLDPEKLPQGAVLEAKLLADDSATWVERADIDKVLKEQKLQAMFSPQGVGERVKLGKLLKADVLVMVRSVKDAKEPALEVVVSETAGGLRLLVRAVPATGDATESVAALLAAAKDGIRRHGEKVSEVVAVPPFVSQNLEFTHDHLRAAYAKLAEVEVFDRKGVVVVELEEAEALAKEITLAAPGSKLDRPLPVYLLGEYRHTGKGKELSVSVKLRAERGGKPVGKPAILTIKPEETPVEIRKWAAETLDALAKDTTPRPPADPKAEAKVLTARAHEYARLGSWAECLALLEASLLLDPDQPDRHAEAVKAIAPLLRPVWQRAVGGVPESLDRLSQLYRRGLAHLEAFADKGGDFSKYCDVSGYSVVMAFRLGAGFLNPYGVNPPKLVIERFKELKEEEKVVMARIEPIFVKQVMAHNRRVPRRPDLPPLTPPKGYDPNARPDPSENRIRLTPITLTSTKPKPTDPIFRPVGLIPAGKGIDVIWANGGLLYLMKEKGKYSLAWQSPNRNTRFNAVTFDGRFVWVSGTRFKEPPLLLVLDPITGKTREITGADGLPEPLPEHAADPTTNLTMMATGLDPGRACVTGWLGRTWIAVVEFDPKTNRVVTNLIHEAREAGNSDDKDQWVRTTVAFQPSFMVTLRDRPLADGTVSTRVLLGRMGSDNLEVNHIPLVIDPDRETVTVANFYLPSGSFSLRDAATITTDGEAMYRAENTICPRVLKVAFPGDVRETVIDGIPRSPGYLLMHEGRTHVVQELFGSDAADKDGKLPPPRGLSGPSAYHWYVIEPGEKRPKAVGVNLPLIRGIAASSHYGLVAIVAPDDRDKPVTLQTVEFDPPKK